MVFGLFNGFIIESVGDPPFRDTLHKCFSKDLSEFVKENMPVLSTSGSGIDR